MTVFLFSIDTEYLLCYNGHVVIAIYKETHFQVAFIFAQHRGNIMKNTGNINTIPLSTPTMHDEEMVYIHEAFDRNWIAPLGFNCDAFEQEVSAYLMSGEDRSLHALALSSGTAALHLAAKLSGIKRDDVVICSDMTFVATVNPMLYEGARPVFVDAERDTWNMDPRALERALQKYPQAKAVVLVQLYGTPAKMDEIAAICRHYGVTLIEDAAEGFGAAYRSRRLGTFGDIGILSFNGNKIITTSSGGMLLTRDPALRAKGLYYATQARENVAWYEHKEIGYNYRLSNVCAGIGRGQLLHLDEHKARKEAIYHRYCEGLADLPVTMNPHEPHATPNHWLSAILLHKTCTRTPLELMENLAAEGIESRPIWKPMHMQPIYADADFIALEEAPVSEDIFRRGLCLPSDIKMTEEEQDTVIRAIHRFL